MKLFSIFKSEEELPSWPPDPGRLHAASYPAYATAHRLESCQRPEELVQFLREDTGCITKFQKRQKGLFTP